MNSPAQYLQFGFVSISVANLLVIVLLIVIFIIAVTLRMPEKQHISTIEIDTHPDEASAGEKANAEVLT
jgi:hypothetical protein